MNGPTDLLTATNYVPVYNLIFYFFFLLFFGGFYIIDTFILCVGDVDIMHSHFIGGTTVRTAGGR